MAKKLTRDSLGYLGVEFQYRLVKAFVEIPNFFREICNVVDQNMFTEPTLKTFVGVFKEYFDKNMDTPSYDMMEIKLREKAYGENDMTYFLDTIKKLRDTSSEGINDIHETASKFFKQQSIIKAANRILQIAGDGDISKYDQCLDIIQKSLNAGNSDDLGTHILDNLDDVLSDDYRCTIPTGIGKIDEILEGGLGKGELGVIIGPSSFGKVMPNDEIVMTPNGPVMNGDLKVGDYVIGRDGKPTKVIGIYPHKDWQFYKVTFSDGVSCECGKEHLWNVNSLYQRVAKKHLSGYSTKENGYKKTYNPDHSFVTMTLGEIMEKGLFRDWGGKHIHNFKVPMCEPVRFNDKSVLIDPYLMGYMIGDGNFKSCVITVGAQDIAESSTNLKYCGIDFNIKQDKKKRFSLRFGVKLKNQLLNYYDINSVAHQKYIHQDYLYNSLNKRIALLNGLMDSDGTCQKNGCSCYNTKSKQLAEDIKTLVLSLGGFAKVRCKKASYFSKKYNKRIDCGIHYEVTITLCDPTIPIFKLKRKQDRVIYRIKRKSERFFEKVEESRVCDGRCIKVDAEDELYLTRDFIVTHNTSLTTAMASHAATCKCEANGNKGFKVVQIVFEDRIKQIQRKHIGRLTNVEAKDLSKPDFIGTVKSKINSLEDKELIKNNVIIKKYASGEITPTQIAQYLRRLINSGFKPDLVIVDYFECLKLERGYETTDSEWTKEGVTMRKLESMASELDIALWVPTQGSRDSLGAEIVTMDKSGGSIKKIQIGHIVMSIARTMEDIAKCLATIAILKNRAGKAGDVLTGVEFNNGTCRISTENATEYANTISFNENKKDEQLELQRNLVREIKQEKGK